jgi:transcriptional regulator with XRE-family HTH domain
MSKISERRIFMAALTEEEIHEYNDSVLERIRQLCVKRGTSITKIEKTLGYGNGTVSGWTKAKKKAPYDRVEAIAKHLGVPTVALTGEPVPANDERNTVTDADLKFALFGGDGEITDAMFEEVKRFAAFVKQREQEKEANKN